MRIPVVHSVNPSNTRRATSGNGPKVVVVSHLSSLPCETLNLTSRLDLPGVDCCRYRLHRRYPDQPPLARETSTSKKGRKLLCVNTETSNQKVEMEVELAFKAGS
jgi:hypothetical protein